MCSGVKKKSPSKYITFSLTTSSGSEGEPGGQDSVTGYEIYSIMQVEADLHVNKKVRNLFIIYF